MVVLSENVLGPAQGAAIEVCNDKQNLVFVVRVGAWAHLEDGLALRHETEKLRVLFTELVRLADLWFADERRNVGLRAAGRSVCF